MIQGAKIKLSLLEKVKGTPSRRAPRAHGSTRKRWYQGPSYVLEEVLASTRTFNEACRCEELGLKAGMHVDELVELGSGCTGETPDGRRLLPRDRAGWVCGRLDAVRRRFGQ